MPQDIVLYPLSFVHYNISGAYDPPWGVYIMIVYTAALLCCYLIQSLVSVILIICDQDNCVYIQQYMYIYSTMSF